MLERIVPLILVFLAGFGLGGFYFGGLWLTVRRLPTARQPALLLMASFLGRMVVVVAGFLVVMQGQWQRAAIALAGFVLARLALIRVLSPDHSPVGSA